MTRDKFEQKYGAIPPELPTGLLDEYMLTVYNMSLPRAAALGIDTDLLRVRMWELLHPGGLAELAIALRERLRSWRINRAPGRLIVNSHSRAEREQVFKRAVDEQIRQMAAKREVTG